MEKDMIKRDDEKKLKFNFEEFKDQIEDLFLACEGQAEIAGLEAAMQECIEQVVDSIIQGEYGGNDDEYLNGGFSFSYPDEEGFITLEEVGYDEYDLTIDLGIKIEDEYEEDDEEDDEEEEKEPTPKPVGRKRKVAVEEKPKGKSKKDLSCPSGHKFGKDTDKYDDCDDCELWNECYAKKKGK